MPKFKLKLLPASDGDCMLLSWGDDGGPLSHMVIDGGRKGAYQHLNSELFRIVNAGEALALYVLTHVDADHIEGALAYLDDVNRPILPKDVWYNGLYQMRLADKRSMRQGDDWSKAIARLKLPLNRHFEGGVASIESALAPIDVEGLKITMLSPDSAHLAAMGNLWTKWRETEERERREGMRAPKARQRPPVPQPLIVENLIADGETDPEPPNGTSIAFLAEWRGRSVLLGGDAHPNVLATSLAPLAESDGGRCRIDLLKASHHGSAKNTTRQLIELLDCRRIAISTNGKLHGHPDPESIARFLHFGVSGPKHIYFNYDTDRTRPWADSNLEAKHNYRVHFPSSTSGAIEIDLMADDLF